LTSFLLIPQNFLFTTNALRYECKLDEGKHLEISDGGDQTIVSFSSRDTGQRQSQGLGFTTAKWVKTPAAFLVGKDIMAWVETGSAARTHRSKDPNDCVASVGAKESSADCVNGSDQDHLIPDSQI